MAGCIRDGNGFRVMAEFDSSQVFDENYFATSCGEPYERSEVWLNLFSSFAERIQKEINPSSVLDAGCAMGFLVEKLRERGIEAWGVDISEYAIGEVAPAVNEYCWVGSVTEPFPSRYDLIVSIEVLEHLPPKDAETAVANLSAFSDDVLFSSTPYDYKEASHFNVQPVEYWAELFAKHGFTRDVDFDASFITPWTVRYRKTGHPMHRVVRDYERKFWFLWKENVDLREQTFELQNQIAGKEPVPDKVSGGVIRSWIKKIFR
jgi:SAM-dependent methyltransferase